MPVGKENKIEPTVNVMGVMRLILTLHKTEINQQKL